MYHHPICGSNHVMDCTYGLYLCIPLVRTGDLIHGYVVRAQAAYRAISYTKSVSTLKQLKAVGRITAGTATTRLTLNILESVGCH